MPSHLFESQFPNSPSEGTDWGLLSADAPAQHREVTQLIYSGSCEIIDTNYFWAGEKWKIKAFTFECKI